MNKGDPSDTSVIRPGSVPPSAYERFVDTNRELETFAYTVAHDLGAPLRAITHLAEDLLNLSRSSSGALVVERVDLSRIADESCAESARVYHTVPTRFQVEPGMSAQADANLARIALDNLIRNAFKFSARAEKPVVEIGSRPQAGADVFFVRDNGIGFDMSEADDLFEPFHRLRSAATFEGSGIGLATVKRIAERHGGRAWVESAPGQGATFYVTLAPSSAS